jgi:hypothetical protein
MLEVHLHLIVVVLLDIILTVLVMVILRAWVSLLVRGPEQFERSPVNPSVRHDSEQGRSDVIRVP